MNVTDVFLNNGQFNWDAINTISNIILVFVLVSITGWYASEVKKQTNLMVIGQKRNKILEEVQAVLTPVIDWLTREIEAIQNKKIGWHRYTSGVCGFDQGLIRLFYNEQYGSVMSAFPKNGSGALRDVLTKFSELNSMFSSHDFLIDELNKLYIEIEKEIKTPEIKELLIKMVQEFNQGKSDTYRFNIENPALFFSKYIINIENTPERTPNSIQDSAQDFWEENQKELLKFRETPQIIEIGKQIRGKLDQLKELDKTTFKKIEEIRENYRKEYNFTDEEVEPFQGGI
jgi:hypothetical protein